MNVYCSAIKPTFLKDFCCFFLRVKYDLQVSVLFDRGLMSEQQSKMTSRQVHGCNLCERSFATSSALKQHYSSIHKKGQGDFQCHVCDRRYTQVSNLCRHLRHDHYTGNGATTCWKRPSQHDDMAPRPHVMRRHVDVTSPFSTSSYVTSGQLQTFDSGQVHPTTSCNATSPWPLVMSSSNNFLPPLTDMHFSAMYASMLRWLSLYTSSGVEINPVRWQPNASYLSVCRSPVADIQPPLTDLEFWYQRVRQTEFGRSSSGNDVNSVAQNQTEMRSETNADCCQPLDLRTSRQHDTGIMF